MINKLISPGTVYNLPFFPEFFNAAIGARDIGSDWLIACQKCARGAVLEVGGGTGRLTRAAMTPNCDYCIVEQNQWFVSHLSELFGLKARVVHGRFPDDTKVGAWNCILMHQNTFFELINETSLVGLVDAVVSSLRPGGIVIFDYPSDQTLDRSGNWRILYSGLLETLGDVSYKYRHLVSFGEVHIVELTLIANGRNLWGDRVPFAFHMPNLNAVVSIFERSGCIVRQKLAPTIQSFYSDKMTIVEVERRDV